MAYAFRKTKKVRDLSDSDEDTDYRTQVPVVKTSKEQRNEKKKPSESVNQAGEAIADIVSSFDRKKSTSSKRQQDSTVADSPSVSSATKLQGDTIAIGSKGKWKFTIEQFRRPGSLGKNTLTNQIRRLKRVQAFIDLAVERKLKPEDFSSVDVLSTLNARKQTKANFEDFLNQFRFVEYQKFVASYLLVKGISFVDAKRITTSLSYFFCNKKHGKSGCGDDCPIHRSWDKEFGKLVVKESFTLETSGVEEPTSPTIAAGQTAYSEPEQAMREATTVIEQHVEDITFEEYIPEKRQREPLAVFGNSDKSVSSSASTLSVVSRGQSTTSASSKLNSDQEKENTISIVSSDSGSSLSTRIGPDVRPRRRSFSTNDVAFVKEIPFPPQPKVIEKNFTFKIGQADWSKVWNMKKMKKLGNYAPLFQAALRKFEIPCSYFSNGYSLLKKGSSLGVVKFRGYCQAGGKTYATKDKKLCSMKYNIYLQTDLDEDMFVFKVSTEGEFVAHQKLNVGRPISGDERKNFVMKLMNDQASKVYLESFTDTPNNELLHGNIPVRSPGQIRQIKSQGNMIGAEPYTNVDDAIENLESSFKHNEKFQSSQFPRWNGYIQRYHKKPHAVMLFSPQQIKYSTFCDKLYIDATGKMTQKRKEDGNLKQVLLHSVVGLPSSIQHVKAIPVAEFLSTAGTAHEIEIMLKTFTTEVKKAKPAWKPTIVVSDFCLAYLHGNSQAFCNMSLDKYINMKYDLLVNRDLPIDPKETTLFVCSGHFLNFNARYLRSKLVGNESRKIALHMFGNLIQATSLKEYQAILADGITLFGADNLTSSKQEEIVNRFMQLEIDVDENQFESDFEATSKSDIDMLSIFPEQDPKLQRDKSKFHVYFEKRSAEIFDQTKRDFDDYDKDDEVEHILANRHKNRRVYETLRRWNVYIPLWSKIAFTRHPYMPEETITTGRVEQYFGELKGSLHKNRNIREDIFIKNQATISLNMVTDALARGFITQKKVTRKTAVRPAPKKPIPKRMSPPKTRSKGSIGNPAYATAKWKRTSGRTKPKYIKPNIRIPPTVVEDVAEDLDISAPARLENEEMLENVPYHKPSEDGITFVDPLSIAEKWWVKESQLIPNLVLSETNEDGDESDILTLRKGLLVSSVIADRVARKIVIESKQKEINVIESTAITHVNGELFLDHGKLPDIAPGQISSSKFVMISMADQHAWLTVVNMKDFTISWFDSSPGLLKSAVRESYYKELALGIESKYSLATKLRQVQKPTPKQIGNECVQMALLALKAFLMKEDPNLLVSPFYAKVYRNDILKLVLSETENGKRLMRCGASDCSLVLDILQRREEERMEINKIMKIRNDIAREKGKTFNNEGKLVAAPNKVLKATQRLLKMVTTHEEFLLSNPFVKSSDLELYLSESEEALPRAAAGANQQECHTVEGGPTETPPTTTEPAEEMCSSTSDVLPTETSPPATRSQTSVSSIPTSQLISSGITLMGGMEKVFRLTLGDDAPPSAAETLFEELQQRRVEAGGEGFVRLQKEKKDLVLKHYKVIESMGLEELRHFFVGTLKHLESVRDGTSASERYELFQNPTPESKQKLRELKVSEPFSALHASELYSLVVTYLYDNKHDFQRFSFVKEVLIQESLVNIYAAANNMRRENAQIEMVDGYFYEGDLHSE